ncbi:MAG: hypothetical protein N2663_00515 [Chlorobi bacterium]|nr:hypothetical protein [Chlorobiota bacterium]
MDSLSTYRRLHRTTLAQGSVFVLLVIVGAIGFFELIALPLLHLVFQDWLGAQVHRFDRWFEWMLVVSSNGEQLYRDTEAKAYLFNPLLALMPIIAAVGFAVATVVSALVPRRLGLVRKNLEREIAQALHELAHRIAGTGISIEDMAVLRSRIESANAEQLDVLAEEYGAAHDELLLLQRALYWARGGIGRALYLGSALRLYMRNHFTVEYEQAVLGSIYVGAAVLIIIIGLRGLQFIPKERPSLVLFAISLEFVLLIAYAATLMFSRPEESEQTQSSELGSLIGSVGTAGSPLASLSYAEKLLRMFIALPPPGRDTSTREQSH